MYVAKAGGSSVIALRRSGVAYGLLTDCQRGAILQPLEPMVAVYLPMSLQETLECCNAV